MLPSPSELQYFIEVANTLNVSRAAERLGVSQPALSLAIQRLEHSFGVPLLLRGKSGVQLTPAGSKLAAQARGLVHEWDKLRGDALRNEQQLTGRYVVGCHVSVALYSLPAILQAVLREHPKLELKLVHDFSRHITADVIAFKIDFGIVVNPVAHPDLVIRELCLDEVGFWRAPGDYISEVLIADPELVQTQALLKQLKRHGLSFERTVSTSSLEVVAQLTASGAGVGILPERVARHVKSHKLKPLGPGLPTYKDRICLVYRPDLQRSEAARRFAKTIEKKFSPI